VRRAKQFIDAGPRRAGRRRDIAAVQEDARPKTATSRRAGEGKESSVAQA